MLDQFNLEELFIYDLANNHQGDLAHATKIAKEVGKANVQAGVGGAFKFQFRQLDTFIHPDYQDRMDIKYVKRFKETKLSMKDFEKLADVVRDTGLLTMSTPFDEESVDIICDMGLDIIKVASCSADDRPLLERIARVNKPVVVSTAGLRVEEIDWLVNFFEAERVDFALMHCVALYPSPDNTLQLAQVRQFTERYRNVPVGWSTHENPDNADAVQIALANGARLFERHVGIETSKYKLNDYSSTPAQLKTWLEAYKDGRAMLGAEERSPSPEGERKTLHDLKRGAYVRKAVSKGGELTRDNVFFAMPMQDGQLTSGQWRPGMVADQDYAAKAPLSEELSGEDVTDEQIVYQIMLQVRGLLNKARIHINEDASIEISHHYGLRRFREYGAVIVTCINREYAKKLVIQLPRQKHPYHFHKKKEETFQLLDGDIEVVKEGRRHQMNPGDTLLVTPMEWHKFHTLDGAVVEEISTTHHNDDSFYEDPAIAKMERSERKTNVDNWLSYFRSRHAI